MIPTRLALVACALVLPGPLLAQGTDATDPMVAVRQLFDAMRAKDTVALRAVFHPEARLMGPGRDRDGKPTVRVTSVDDFVRAVGSAVPYLDERIHDPETRVDGDLATVWTPYEFYADSAFSHCGVDALQLARIGKDWRIIQVADTRRRDGCPGAGAGG
jgi:hypothetical protein